MFNFSQRRTSSRNTTPIDTNLPLSHSPEDVFSNDTSPNTNISNQSNQIPTTAPSRPSSASPTNHDRPPSSAFNRREAPSRSSYSEGYPSWLPRRPPPPAPASTFHSSIRNDLDLDTDLGMDTDLDRDLNFTPSPIEQLPPVTGGRKPTPRSVRIVNLQQSQAAHGTGVSEERREPTDQTRVAEGSGYGYGLGHARAHSQHYPHRHGRKRSSAATNAAEPKTWSRGTSAPPLFNPPGSIGQPGRRARPKFNTRGLQLELVLIPSRWMKAYYRLWPLLALAHVPLQTFLDFNTVFMLLQISKFPNPSASPNSSKNWALGAAAYIACWFAWVFVIFILYELVYSFARRWRVRRPLIFPIYLSSPAYTYACMSSYNHFCFLQHLRWTAFFPISPEVELTSEGEGGDEKHTPPATPHTPGYPVSYGRVHATTPLGYGHPGVLHERSDSTSSAGSRDGDVDSDGHELNGFQRWRREARRGLRRAKAKLETITWRDGLAETFNYYAQNTANIVVLLPRAGLALAVLLAFSSVPVDVSFSSSFDNTPSQRDATFFRRDDGLLTGYAKGVLWANVAWTGWRFAVLLSAWLGLWILSGHSCAGICGPRDKWEEQENNRLSLALSVRSMTSSNAEDDVLPWEWRECTRARIQDAWEFCMVGVGWGLRWGVGPGGVIKEKERDRKDKEPVKPEDEGLDDEGVKRVLAAVGFPSVPTPARRGVLTEDLFESPTKGKGSPKNKGSKESDVGMLASTSNQGQVKDKDAPLLRLPYPFTKPGSGQVSSKDSGLVPFPRGELKKSGSKSSKNSSGKSGSKKSRSSSSKSSKSQSGSGSNKSGSGSSSGSGSVEEEEDEDDEEDEEEEEEDDEEKEDEEEEEEPYSEEPSTSTGGGRASNSMSSLGNPIPPASSAFASRSIHTPPIVTSSSPHSSALGSPLSSPLGSPMSAKGSTRFPFLSGSSARRPGGAGGQTVSMSSSGHSRGLSQVSGWSGLSGLSAVSAGSGYAASGSAGASAVGGRESMDSEGRARSSLSQGSRSGGNGTGTGGVGIPMPPRHPRTRAGTVPSVVHAAEIAGGAAAGGSVAFPSVRRGEKKPRGRVGGVTTTASSSSSPTRQPVETAMDVELGMGMLANPARRQIMGRTGEGDDQSLQLPDDEDEEDEIDEDEDEEARGERADRVGLLSNASSPHPSLLGAHESASGSSGSLSSSHQSRAGSRHSSSAGSRSISRSRHSSVTRGVSNQGYRRESMASAVRERASSLGVKVRERATSMMQTVVAGVVGVGQPAGGSAVGTGSVSMTNLALPASGSKDRSRTNSMMEKLEEGIVYRQGGHRRLESGSTSTPDVIRVGSGVENVGGIIRSVSGQSGESRETGESGSSGSSGNVRSVGSDERTRQIIEEEAYSSSSHSRSGSGSIASGGENYTFGRPMPFLVGSGRERVVSSTSMRSAPRVNVSSPAAQQSSAYAQEEGDDQEIDVDPTQDFLHTPTQPTRAAALRSRTTSLTPSSLAEGEHFYSREPSERAVSPPGTRHASFLSSGVATPVPHLTRQEAIDIPWSQSQTQRLLQPPAQRWVGIPAGNRSLSPSGSGSGEGSGEGEVMLSSVAESFVTAPASVTGGSSMITGSETGTISGSWEEGGFVGRQSGGGGFMNLLLGGTAAATGGVGMPPPRGRRDSGMVERVADGMGAGGGVGDGRIA